MKLGLVSNVLDADVSGQTTFRLALQAVNREHDVWLLSTGNFSYEPHDAVTAMARRIPPGPHRDLERLAQSLKSKEARPQWITVDELDVVLLRSNPTAQKPWAQFAGINFGRLAMRHGVIVLNDPNGLAKAMNKLYFQTFPEEVRPRTLITRDIGRIRQFADDHESIVIKPLQGSGGANVFMVQHKDIENLEQMVQAVTRDGYLVAQEYLPAAAEGDTRLFLMNGLPLVYKGKYAAFRRIRSGEDVRSNVHAGGRIRKAELSDEAFRLAELVRPRLVEDGMFLVGLDIAGDKLLEVNVFSPGGLGNAQRLESVNFDEAVVQSIERKVTYMRHYRRTCSNVGLATL